MLGQFPWEGQGKVTGIRLASVNNLSGLRASYAVSLVAWPLAPGQFGKRNVAFRVRGWARQRSAGSGWVGLHITGVLGQGPWLRTGQPRGTSLPSQEGFLRCPNFIIYRKRPQRPCLSGT